MSRARHYRFRRLNEGRQPPRYAVLCGREDVGQVVAQYPVADARSGGRFAARPRIGPNLLAEQFVRLYRTRVDAANAIVAHLERNSR